MNNVVEMRPAYVELDFDEVERALLQTNGSVAAAALHLRVPRSRLDLYIRKNAGIQYVLQQINESTIDYAEQVVFEALNDPQLRYQAAKFILQTKGKARGWTNNADKISVDASKSGKIEISWGEGDAYFDPSRTIEGEVA